MFFVYTMLAGCEMHFEVNCAVVGDKFELSLKGTGLQGFKGQGTTLPEAMESLALAVKDISATPSKQVAGPRVGR